MTAVISPPPFLYFPNNNNTGAPAAGFLLFTYLAGTTTKQATWTDSTQSVTNANPLPLDANGVAAAASSSAVWLDPTLLYKFVWAPANDTDPPSSPIRTIDNIAGPLTIATLTQAVIGLILYPRTAAEIAAGVTPTKYYYPPGNILRYGADPTGSSDSQTAISNADAQAAAGGDLVYFPGGAYRVNSTINKLANANWQGESRNGVVLRYYGNSVLINAVGTDPSRKLFTISDVTLDGTNAGSAAEGIRFGWNQRSTPLIRVHIQFFGHYGIHFTDQNWNVDFFSVEVDTCGRTTANSAGIFKDAAIDVGTWNAISFYDLIVEACGTASSTAGGVNIPTTTTNRGLYFYSPIIEGNFGALQIFVTNMSDLDFENLYMEPAASAPGQTAFVEIDGGTASFRGGFLTGSGATAGTGVILKAGVNSSMMGVTFSSWATTGVSVQGSSLYTGNNPGFTFTLDSTAQIWGQVAPCWAVTSNVNQTGIVNNTVTKVSWQTKNKDVTTCFDNVTNFRATPQTIGLYRHTVQVRWDTNVTAFDQYHIFLEVNGSIVAEKLLRPGELAAFEHQAVFDNVPITASSDFFEVFVRHVDGGAPANRTLITGSTVTWWTGALLSR